ncbi:MAG: nuclear transport factor 2 family protein [Bacteroidota bacterium]
MKTLPYTQHSLTTVFAVVFFLNFFGITYAQVDSSSELYKTLKANDSLLFEEGFNKCRLEAFEHLIAEDLEFYHDLSGITRSKESFIETFRRNICGNPEQKPRRDLIPGTLVVYPLYNQGELYGAIQQGTHRFYQPAPDGSSTPGSTALFTHLWLKNDDGWEIKRVLSYEHRPE